MNNQFGKIISASEAVTHIKDGMSVMVGGFGGVGTAPTMIDELLDKDVSHLTLICNDTGFPHIGVGKLVSNRRIKKVIASHIGSNPIAGSLMTEGVLEVEFSPQGTLAERIRAGGVGLGGVLVDIGIDVEVVNQGKEVIEIDGRPYLVEEALTADVSIVYAKKSDPFGNLLYDKSARNTNPLVAMAGAVTIAEVEEVVPLGEIDAEEVMTSGVFVDYIVPSKGVNWKWVWE
ncbi:CoA transferase subunit A [Metabacillus iocasae]|uniref:Acetate CoA/acetoacetate CoA-transferase alpha subunit n=1 Tax=Priestia iocasae TaxID=2291674 RepID=A0ABS2QUM1_9BACI|nr:CoA transferase subunit A [Metabacillus iocasae]MBM7703185.1 acetate CoA/acetoacetate CoA-transferase alpha subunit [Metabacillus iocasae]